VGAVAKPAGRTSPTPRVVRQEIEVLHAQRGQQLAHALDVAADIREARPRGETGRGTRRCFGAEPPADWPGWRGSRHRSRAGCQAVVDHLDVEEEQVGQWCDACERRRLGMPLVSTAVCRPRARQVVSIASRNAGCMRGSPRRTSTPPPDSSKNTTSRSISFNSSSTRRHAPPARARRTDSAPRRRRTPGNVRSPCGTLLLFLDRPVLAPGQARPHTRQRSSCRQAADGAAGSRGCDTTDTQGQPLRKMVVRSRTVRGTLARATRKWWPRHSPGARFRAMISPAAPSSGPEVSPVARHPDDEISVLVGLGCAAGSGVGRHPLNCRWWPSKLESRPARGAPAGESFPAPRARRVRTSGSGRVRLSARGPSSPPPKDGGLVRPGRSLHG